MLFRSGENYYVVGVTNREDASMEEFAKERGTLMEQMLTQKRNEVFQDFIASTRRKLESEGRIAIYPEAIGKLETPELPFGEEIPVQ